METSKSLFSLKNDLGEEKTYEMLFTFDSDVTKKSYMVYTDHYMDKDGKEIIVDKKNINRNQYIFSFISNWCSNILSNIFRKSF